MTVFMSRLQRYVQDRPKGDKIEVTVVAHSMGTFIVNQMVRAYPEVHYKTIVYMAGADSIRNTFNSILPYLNQSDHEETNFVNLTLHPQAEVEEMSGYGLLPRGSLLVWVDNLFSTPHTHYDRTVGRWDNLLPTLGEIPTRLKSRVKIKAFDQDSKIATHGDFTENDFWREEFWRPGKPECNPWPLGNEASCPKPSLSQATQCK
jgi:pimeloyl-ACP methyl ester carboxylesterase